MAGARRGTFLGPLVDAPLRERGELLVGCLLLLEGAAENCSILAMTQFPRPCDQRAVTGDLIMLHRLRRRDQPRSKDVLVAHIAHEIVALANDAVDCRAFVAAGLLVVQLEDLLEAADLLLRLAQMLLQPALEF